MVKRLFFVAPALLALLSCSRQQTAEAPTPAEQAPEAAAQQQSPVGPRATVHLKDGSKVPGSIVASSQNDMVVAGDDGIERKIPLAQVKSVEYGEPAAAPERASQTAREPAPPKASPRAAAPPARQAPPETAAKPAPVETASRPAPGDNAPPPSRAAAARTNQVPAGAEISVRTNETIDSATANEGQTFDAQVTRDVTNAGGEVVIPRGANARVVIRSASQGGKIRGASDLALALQSVTIGGRPYVVETADVTKKGTSGVGANKRTAEYAGGGAALGAVIGAIAGGGRGAAIGAGAGAGAGVLTQILTKGRAIKVPAESVLTFQLDRPLHVAAM